MTDTASHLLKRGKLVLGIAAVAHAKSTDGSVPSWQTLTPELGFATGEVVELLEHTYNPKILSQAVSKALNLNSETGIPKWIVPVINNPALLNPMGEQITVSWAGNQVAEHQRGIAAVATALCRTIDVAETVAEHLPQSDSTLLIEWTYLAAALVLPGEPSAVRQKLVTLLKQLSPPS